MDLGGNAARRAVIYARYSTDLQNDRSIEDQIALCRDHGSRRGLTIVGVYSDSARSGSSLFGRDGVAEMMDAARAGAFDVIIVEALDRISRDQEDLAGIFKRTTHYRVKIDAVHDGIADAMQVGLRGLMGSIFLTDLKHKTRRGMAGVIREGRSAGGRAYGYRPIPGRPGELEIVPEEAAAIVRIFEAFVGGAAPRDIAADLNRERVQPPRGLRWNASTINGNAERGNGILLNAIYDGRIVWNRTTMVRDPDTGKRISRLNAEAEWQHSEAPHLRIVPADLFAAAQARKTGQSRRRAEGGYTRKPKRLLSGMIRCGACGAGMSMHDQRSGRPRIRCSANRESGVCASTKKYYLDRIENAVVEGLRGVFSDPEIVGAYLSAYREAKRAEIAEATRNRTKIERRLMDVSGKIERLIDMHMNGVISMADLKDRIAGLEEAKREATAALARASADIPSIELHPGAITAYRKNIDTVAARLASAATLADDPLERGVIEAFRAMVDHVVVRDAADGAYEVDVVGPLSALTGEKLPDGGKALVAGEGLEPPTRGL